MILTATSPTFRPLFLSRSDCLLSNRNINLQLPAIDKSAQHRQEPRQLWEKGWKRQMLIPTTSRTRILDDGWRETTSFNRKTADLMFALAVFKRNHVHGLVPAVYLIPLITRLRKKRRTERCVISASIATGESLFFGLALELAVEFARSLRSVKSIVN